MKMELSLFLKMELINRYLIIVDVFYRVVICFEGNLVGIFYLFKNLNVFFWKKKFMGKLYVSVSSLGELVKIIVFIIRF